MKDKPKKKWKLVYKGNIDSFDPAISVDYWQKKSTIERFRETQSLIENAMKIKGIDTKNVSRLLRTTAVLKRS